MINKDYSIFRQRIQLCSFSPVFITTIYTYNWKPILTPCPVAISSCVWSCKPLDWPIEWRPLRWNNRRRSCIPMTSAARTPAKGSSNVHFIYNTSLLVLQLLLESNSDEDYGVSNQNTTYLWKSGAANSRKESISPETPKTIQTRLLLLWWV